MSRRHLLNAISFSSESGGGTVNTGKLYKISEGLGATYELRWTYPVTSRIDVYFSIEWNNTINTHSLTTNANDTVSYNTFMTGPGEIITGVASIVPTSDNTYIYEVVI